MRTIDEQIQIVTEDQIICTELGKVGIIINSISELVNTSKSYPDGVPVLLSLLFDKRIKSDNMKEAIVRSLTVKEAKKKAVPILLHLYNQTDKSKEFRWTIGNAIGFLLVDENVEDILTIVKDKSNGTSRQMLVHALGKVKKEKSKIVPVLIPLLDDEDVRGHAINALGKLRSVEAKEKIAGFLTNSNAWLRGEAKKALKKIGESDR